VSSSASKLTISGSCVEVRTGFGVHGTSLVRSLDSVSGLSELPSPLWAFHQCHYITEARLRYHGAEQPHEGRAKLSTRVRASPRNDVSQSHKGSGTLITILMSAPFSGFPLTRSTGLGAGGILGYYSTAAVESNRSTNNARLRSSFTTFSCIVTYLVLRLTGPTPGYPATRPSDEKRPMSLVSKIRSRNLTTRSFRNHATQESIRSVNYCKYKRHLEFEVQYRNRS